MNRINQSMKWIMLIAGVLTLGMIAAAIAPQTVLASMFGATLEGALAEVMVRSWGVSVAITGGMLIYGAFHIDQRPLVLTVVVISKITFVGLGIVNGFGQQLAGPIVADSVLIILFCIYLFTNKNQTEGTDTLMQTQAK